MNKNSLIILIFLLVGIGLSSCTDNISNGMRIKPSALGKRNKIRVISDENLWEGAIRDSFEFYFGAAYPIMPQPEPLFNISHFTVQDLTAEPLRKNLRTYVILSDLSDENSLATKMLIQDLGQEKYQEALLGKGKLVSAGTDKWANKQLIIYLYGKDEQALAESIRTNFAKVAKRINQHDNAQLASSTFALKTQHILTNAVMERYKFNMRIPGDFKEAKYDAKTNVSWFRKDAKSGILNIAIQTEKYTREEQFTKDYIIKKRDEFGKKYVSTNEPNSFMISNTIDLPVYTYRHKYGNMETIEIRGIWEIENDFMGGPYFSYALYNEPKGEIIYIDCFVLRQGKDKRDLMQQLEHVVASMQGI